MLAWIRSLDPRLPRSVQLLQLGGLVSAFGNGIVMPFTLLYLHDVRGISLGTAGLALGALALGALVAGPVAGALVDRFGGRKLLSVALILLTAGYGGFAFVHEPWQAFATAIVAGAGNGAFWPAQSTLLAGLTPPEKRPVTWSMQRVVMNLGVGLGALVGGLVADVDRPATFELIFVVDGLTFIAYLAIVRAFVPDHRPMVSPEAPAGRYVDVLADRAFVAVIGLNTLLVFAGMAGLELLPVYAENQASVSESAIGVVFFVNTVVIVLAQLPITRLSSGYRRMRALALLGLVWAACWALVPLVGEHLDGRRAAFAFALVLAVFGLGECIHGAVQGPLVADLATPALLGRYMALSASSWQVGFALGPAAGGFGLEHAPSGVWLAAAVLCIGASGAALRAERHLPHHAVRTPAHHAGPA